MEFINGAGTKAKIAEEELPEVYQFLANHYQKPVVPRSSSAYPGNRMRSVQDIFGSPVMPETPLLPPPAALTSRFSRKRLASVKPTAPRISRTLSIRRPSASGPIT